MNRTTELRLLITGDGKILRTSLHEGERDVKTFTGRVKQMFGGLGRSVKGGIVGQIWGVAGAAAVMALGKQVINFDAEIMRLARNGRMTVAEMMRLKESIVETGIGAGQAREDVKAGIDAIVERTGNIGFAVDSMQTLAETATGTGAEMNDLGALASNLNEKMDIDAEGLKTVFNILNAQGKSGAFTLEKMASNGERLFGAYRGFGKGVQAVREYGAFIQIAQSGTGSPEQATTAVERTLSAIIDKQDVIKKLGVEVFSDRSKQQFKGVGEILKSLIVASKGNLKILGDIFGEEGIRAVKVLSSAYLDTGGFAIYDNLVNADAKYANELMSDYAAYTTTAAFKLKVLVELGKKFADSALSKPIEELSKWVSDLTSDTKRIEELGRSFQSLGEILAATARLVKFITLGVDAYQGAARNIAESAFTPQMVENQWRVIPKRDKESLSKRFGVVDGISKRRGQIDAKRRAVDAYLTENKINLTVNIDGNGRINTRTDDLHTRATVKLNRGDQTARQ